MKIILPIIALTLFLTIIALNFFVKRTNAYRNFYRAIHVVKDVKQTSKYHLCAFGSTFSYYAYDLKKYNGHNFSVEPQSFAFMRKTVNHFINNIDNGGIALLSLTGCIFASNSTLADEKCLTYQSYLNSSEIGKNDIITRVKYYLKRYLPVLSPYYLKCIINDETYKYDDCTILSTDVANKQAKKRVKGWERVVGRTIDESFSIDENLKIQLEENVTILKDIISDLRGSNIIPVVVILPVSEAFHENCPRVFDDKLLYYCLDQIKTTNVPILDYLYDEELMNLTYYFMADCLNKKGRELLTSKIVKDIGINV